MRESKPFRDPLTEIDLDPKRKEWTAWHEAGHIVTVWALSGHIQDVVLEPKSFEDYDLNMSVSWFLPDYAGRRTACCAGAVIDQAEGWRYTTNLEEVLWNSRQDREELARFMKMDHRLVTPATLGQEFQRGVKDAAALLQRRRNRRHLIDVRDFILGAYLKGIKLLSAEDLAPLRN